jgi:Fur family ferric uptake transcriptional regulator
MLAFFLKHLRFIAVGDICQPQKNLRCANGSDKNVKKEKLERRLMAETLLDKCLGRNIRMTSQRQTIIKVIEGSDDHPDVDQLYLRSVAQDNTISIATVYRTVKLLEEAGVIEKLEFGDGRARYEEAREHHEHLVDVETGEVIEFFHAELEALKEEIAQKMGYELIDHRLELYGKKIKDS